MDWSDYFLTVTHLPNAVDHDVGTAFGGFDMGDAVPELRRNAFTVEPFGLVCVGLAWVSTEMRVSGITTLRGQVRMLDRACRIVPGAVLAQV